MRLVRVIYRLAKRANANPLQCDHSRIVCTYQTAYYRILVPMCQKTNTWDGQRELIPVP